MRSQFIPPLWLIVCAAVLASCVEVLVIVMKAEYPVTLFDGARFLPCAAFLIVLAAWEAYAFWRWFVPNVPDAELDKLPICKVCGYDLRASEDRCPECGTPVPWKSEANG